jgi:hypothetical protein
MWYRPIAMRSGAVTRKSIDAAVNAPTFPIAGGLTGATVTPRDHSVYFAPTRSPVVWNGTRSTRLWPETTWVS